VESGVRPKQLVALGEARLFDETHSETIKEFLKMQKKIGFWEDPLQPYNPNKNTSPGD